MTPYAIASRNWRSRAPSLSLNRGWTHALCTPRARGRCRSARWTDECKKKEKVCRIVSAHSHGRTGDRSCVRAASSKCSGQALYISMIMGHNMRPTAHDSPPEQDVDPGYNRKVHVCLDLVRYVGPETSPHDNVPAPPVSFFKRFPDARRDRCEHLPAVSSIHVDVAGGCTNPPQSMRTIETEGSG